MSPDTMCQGVIIMLMNPGPYWPLSFWGFHLPVGEGQRTALCQGGVLAARSIGPKVTRLVICGSGETKDKNFSPTFLNRRWRRGRSRRSRKSGHICLNILVVGAFHKNSSIVRLAEMAI